MNTKVQTLVDNIKKVIVGKDDIILQTVTAMLAGGHVLIEDVPGLGKTRLAVALAKSVNGGIDRIQFTSDVNTVDVIGCHVLNQNTKQYEFKRGAAFCNFLLADEINRSSPKVKANLLELMEMRQISVDRVIKKAMNPFMVLATQNPIDAYGSSQLSEAELDRFMMKISIGYPNANEEIEILDRSEVTSEAQNITAVMTTDDINAMIQEVDNVKVVTPVKQYIVEIVRATRDNDFITFGASPRGSIALYDASKAYAYIQGRNTVIPEDVIAMAKPVLTHRIILSAIGKSTCKTPEATIDRIISKTSMPVL